MTKKAVEGFNGGVVFTGEVGTELFRLMMLRRGLIFEARTGMKMTRGPKVSTILRRQYDIRGRWEKQLVQLDKLIAEQEKKAHAQNTQAEKEEAEVELQHAMEEGKVH